MTPEMLAKKTMASVDAESIARVFGQIDALVKAGAKIEIDRQNVPVVQVDGKWRTDETTGCQVIIRLRDDRTGAWTCRIIERPVDDKQAKLVAKEVVAEFRGKIKSVKTMRAVERANRY